ncbi:MAG: indole-3-glycerol phosphate synthase TrpC [Candidatus Omnitrophica bacterium]|nr:indole-3-glycerol phosphate synthase TrpC [Candidatus Omnitrophota bacterium]
MILSEILQAKRQRLKEAKEKISLSQIKDELASKKIERRSFKHAISNPHGLNLIAEIKRASPSRGLIREDFNPAKIAETYQINGAHAISVLTEEDYFQGKLEHIKKVRAVTSIPVLRKDFIVDEYQVYESAHAEADAILLITDILSKEELARFFSLAKSLGMGVLCEAHAEEELKKAIAAKVDIIGINNRDLNTFKLSIQTTQNLIDLVPEGKIIVSESGIRSSSDAMFLKSLGVHAVLVGELFMDADDIGAKVREFLGK